LIACAAVAHNEIFTSAFSRLPIQLNELLLVLLLDCLSCFVGFVLLCEGFFM
jgi:hypothetical protein